MNHNPLFIIRNSSQEGFLALMSAIIISAVLMIVVFSVGFSGFMTRFNILDSEYKTRSYTLAEGYANQAMIALAQGLSGSPSYTNGVPVPISGTSEDYYLINVSGSDVTVQAHAVVERATTNFDINATYSGGNLTINSWEEVPNF